MRARCRYCGAVRAKNSTRQVEHLQQCNDFLNSTEGEQARADGLLDTSPAQQPSSSIRPDVFRGTAPNTGFSLNRQRGRANRPSQLPSQRPGQAPAQPKPAPSLVNHLLAKNNDALTAATQQQFLSRAGCGTLSPQALEQWLTQQNHMSRALVILIGNLIGKIRLVESKNPLADTNWRTLDLLVSCVNNAKRELEFLRTTGAKYGLRSDDEGPKHATKGLIDMFGSATQPHASLLEGMVVLWAIQHVSSLIPLSLVTLVSLANQISSTASPGNTPSPSSKPAHHNQLHTLFHHTCNQELTTTPTIPACRQRTAHRRTSLATTLLSARH